MGRLLAAVRRAGMVHPRAARNRGGIFGGFLWGAIPGALKAFTGAHEVIVTIMLNYIAILLVDWLIKSTEPVILLDVAASTPRTPFIHESARLPVLSNITSLVFIAAGVIVLLLGLWQRRAQLSQDIRYVIRPVVYGLLVAVGGLFLQWITVRGALHIGFFIMLIAVWFVDWFLNRTTLGFELRTVGTNPNAARYAGMSVPRNVIFALAFSGALAGLAGTIEISGVQFNMQPAFFSGLGFDAIAVALLARSNPRNMIWAGLLWAALLTGAGLMQVRANISIDLVKIIQALIIMFIAADAIIRYIWAIPKTTDSVQTYVLERMGRLMASISSPVEPRAAHSMSWRDIKITRTLIFSILFILAGAVLLAITPPSMTGETVTTLTFGEGMPSIPVPTLTYTLIVGAYYIIAGIVGLISVPQRLKTILLLLVAS